MKSRVMTRVGLVILGLALTAAAGCGSGSATNAPPSEPGGGTTIYFLIDHGRSAIGVRRRLGRSSDPARSALRLLLQGPTATERKYGVSTAIPAKVAIRSLSVSTRAPYGLAVVDLSGLPSPETAGPVRVTQIATQLARSLIGLSAVTRVSIRSNGRPWGLFAMRGGILGKPWDYALFVSLWRVCGGKWHTRLSTGPCFSPLP
jgi:spore germination protein GerM